MNRSLGSLLLEGADAVSLTLAFKATVKVNNSYASVSTDDSHNRHYTKIGRTLYDIYTVAIDQQPGFQNRAFAEELVCAAIAGKVERFELTPPPPSPPPPIPLPTPQPHPTPRGTGLCRHCKTGVALWTDPHPHSSSIPPHPTPTPPLHPPSHSPPPIPPP